MPLSCSKSMTVMGTRSGALSSIRVVACTPAPSISSTSISTSTSTSTSTASSLRFSSRSYASSSGPPDRDSTSGDSRLEILKKSLYPPVAQQISLSKAPSTLAKVYGEDIHERTQLVKSVREDPSTPTGAYRPDVVARLFKVLDPASGGRAQEIHETIQRAYLLNKRLKREAQKKDLEKKYQQMVKACDQLKALDASSSSSSSTSSSATTSQSTSSSSSSSSSASASANSTESAPSVKPESALAKRLIHSAFTRPDPRNSPTVTLPEGAPKLNLPERKWHGARIEGFFPREFWVPRETWAQEGQRWDYEWKRIRGSL